VGGKNSVGVVLGEQFVDSLKTKGLNPIVYITDDDHYTGAIPFLTTILQYASKVFATTSTAVEEEGHDVGIASSRPATYTFAQNVPNPFNPQTTIRYALPERADICLVVYDLTGRRVRTLVRGVQQQGRYTVVWDGRDTVGREVASGIYFYQLEAIDRGFVKARRMVLVR
jgi:hypothetical protein